MQLIGYGSYIILRLISQNAIAQENMAKGMNYKSQSC